MDTFSAAQGPEDRARPFDLFALAAPLEVGHADDNLGDEAAFPSTWQQLTGGDAQID